MEVSASRSGCPSPLLSNSSYDISGTGLPDPSFKPCSQLHRSFAEVVKNRNQSSSRSQQTNLLEKINALEAELSLLRAHLRLEESFTASILHYLTDSIGKEAACPNCVRKKVTDRSIRNHQTIPVEYVKVAIPVESESLLSRVRERSEEETSFLFTENNLGSSYIAHDLSYEELSGAHSSIKVLMLSNGPMHTTKQVQHTVNPEIAVIQGIGKDGNSDFGWDNSHLALEAGPKCTVLQKPHDSLINVIPDIDMVRWYNSNKVLVHEASGMTYLPDCKTFIMQVSNNGDDIRVLFYGPKNDSFFIIQSGDLGRENQKVLRDQNWDRNAKYSRNSTGFNPGFVSYLDKR